MSDLISRQAAIDGVIKSCFGQANVVQAEAAAIQHIKRIPSAEPERPKGHWKKISPAGIYECDLCGKNVMTRDIDAYDFCHGCGAKMEPKQILSEADNGPAYGGLMSAT